MEIDKQRGSMYIQLIILMSALSQRKGQEKTLYNQLN